jgi:hypothetical protein
MQIRVPLPRQLDAGISAKRQQESQLMHRQRGSRHQRHAGKASN